MARSVRGRGRIERAGQPLGDVVATLYVVDAHGYDRGEWGGTLTGELNWSSVSYGEELTLRIEDGGAGTFLVRQRVIAEDGVYIEGVGLPPG
jgi:hypothetical protein